MKLTVLALFLLGSFASADKLPPQKAAASIYCYQKPDQVLTQGATQVEFKCGTGNQIFTGVCDLTTDPVETGKPFVDIKVAKWEKHGDNQGLAGKFGFIVCTKK